jgi:hypothetical protein
MMRREKEKEKGKSMDLLSSSVERDGIKRRRQRRGQKNLFPFFFFISEIFRILHAHENDKRSSTFYFFFLLFF